MTAGKQLGQLTTHTHTPPTHTQRQRVFFIPVHEVTGNWKGKEFTYWVYGTNNAANCPDYPGNTCDCCTIL